MLKLMTRGPAGEPLSVKMAAEMLGRSETWVRDHLASGLLERVTSATGQIMVSAESVAWAKSLGRPRPRTKLRLVVNNTGFKR